MGRLSIALLLLLSACGDDTAATVFPDAGPLDSGPDAAPDAARSIDTPACRAPVEIVSASFFAQPNAVWSVLAGGEPERVFVSGGDGPWNPGPVHELVLFRDGRWFGPQSMGPPTSAFQVLAVGPTGVAVARTTIYQAPKSTTVTPNVGTTYSILPAGSNTWLPFSRPVPLFDGLGNGVALGRVYLADQGWQQPEAIMGSRGPGPYGSEGLDVALDGRALYSYTAGNTLDERLGAATYLPGTGWKYVAEVPLPRSDVHYFVSSDGLERPLFDHWTVVAAPTGGGWIVESPPYEPSSSMNTAIPPERAPVTVWHVDPLTGFQQPDELFLDDPAAQGTPVVLAMWIEPDGVSVLFKQRRPLENVDNGLWWSRFRAGHWSRPSLLGLLDYDFTDLNGGDFKGSVAVAYGKVVVTWPRGNVAQVNSYTSERGWSPARPLTGTVSTDAKAAMTTAGAATIIYKASASLWACRFNASDL